MLRMVVCCGGGFSSSALSTKMRKDIEKNNLQDMVSVSFIPFHDFKNENADYDIALLCPHLLRNAQKFVEETNFNRIPIYMIPPRLYGLMSFEALYEDALDLIEAFKVHAQNLAFFPGEADLLRNQRMCSYRKAKNTYLSK